MNQMIGIRYIFPLALSFILSHSLLAQQKSTVKGRIIDETTQESIEYASVALYSVRDSSLIEGSITDVEGEFGINSVPGNYRINIRFIGYEEKVIDNIGLGTSTLDLGTITLKSGAENLDEVTVAAAQLAVRHKIDRQVYSTSEFEASVGGTASDILKNLPSITMNAEGELSVRGSSGFVILLNGKPVQSDATSLLNQLPANAVEDIEVITSPSARYDPEGKAGIINIITKKGASDGLYLLTNVLIGAPSFDDYDNRNTASRFGGDFTLNFREKKWDISLGADYSRNDVTGFREGFVETHSGDTITSFPSVGERSFRKENYSTRAVIGYEVNKSNQINASVYAGVRSQYRTADLLYRQSKRVSDQALPFTALGYFNENGRERTSEFFISSLDYTKLFENRSSLTASALYEKTVLSGPTKNLNLNPENLRDTINYQVMDEFNPLDGVRFNLDYTLPITEGSAFKAGYQYRWLKHVGQFDFREKIQGRNDYNIFPGFGSDIDLIRKIHSLYGEYSNTIENFSYSAGARIEHTDRTLEDYSRDRRYDFTLWNLFPSLSLNYSTDKDFTWKASYSRRIERTTTNMMNPFLARRHSEILEVGDPELKPELIDAIEVGIVKDFENNSLFANIYYRKVNNVINRVNSVHSDSILYRTYTNAGISQAGGMEMGADLNPTDWWKVYLGGNLYRYDLQGEIIGATIKRNSWNYSFNINTGFDLGNNWELLFNMNYLSRVITVQGEDSRFFSPNTTLKKSLMNDRLTFALQWKNMGLDWLESNRQTITAHGENFYTSTNYIYERDMVMLTISYRINQLARKINFTKSEFGDREF